MNSSTRLFFKDYKMMLKEKGTVLLKPGGRIDTIYFVAKGLVRQYAVTPSGEEITVHIYRPGSFFPIVLVLAGVPNRFYFTAVSDVEVRAAPTIEVLAFLKDSPEALFDLTTRLAKAIDGLATRIEHGLPLRAHDRVRRLLAYWTKKFGDKRLTHKEIASWLGLSRETVSREMKKLKKKQ